MMKKSYRPHALACLSLAFLLISGCANVNLQSHIAQSPAEALDVAAQESDREAAQRYLLRMASRLQEQGNHVAARTVLRSSQLQSPVDTVRLQAWLLSMASAVALDDAGWAGELAAQMSPDTFTGYPGDLMARAANLQAQTYTLAGRPLDGAQTLILLAQADPEADVQALHDQIWQALKRVPEPRLAEASSQAIGYESQGWLELAAQLRQPGLSLDDQGRMIRRWQNHWPGHPAAQVLPSELQLIAGLAASRPEKIALALPLDGAFASAGKAIRDGFLAAYYLDASADRSKTDIRVFNTATRSFASLYSELASQDFDLIVGPLEKEALSAVAGMNTLPVPVLGLNYLPEGTVAPEGLYQYGLSAEDEARQIADRLSQEHLNQVLALIPRGDWGDRVEKALLSRLREDGGAALDVERFFREDNLRTVTADVLGITASRERAIQVERTIGVNVEFEPRRRQDADAIVMVAEPTVARQFKPLFAFYFGGDLPVYAPSIVYEGTPNPARDRDLNGVTFTDIPWVLAEQDALRRQAQAHLSGTHGQLGRLFAMGADAWQLSKRLPLLRQVDGAAIDGQTGRLTMTPDGRVHREQLWARFENGRPKLLTPTPEEPAATD